MQDIISTYPIKNDTKDECESRPELSGARRSKLWLVVNVSLAILALAGTVSLMVLALAMFQDRLAGLGHWAYAGVVLAEFANSASVFVPTPGPAYTFAVAPGLNPLAVGLIGGVAAALGELVGYTVGAKGRNVIPNGWMHNRLEPIANRWGGAALFAFAAMPIPFDFAGVWAGVAKYPIHRFLAYVALGKVIKITIIAIAATYSVGWLAGLSI